MTAENGRLIRLTLDAEGERLDRALTAAYPELSRVQWQRLIQSGQVTLNGRPLKASMRLAGGEAIEAFLPEVVDSSLDAEAIPLDIRYEDEDIIVVNKPAGMVVHPSFGHESGTLVNALLAHCPDLAGVGGERRPGIVHRLDKDTSGLIVAAKSDAALRAMQSQFKARTVSKRYLALVHGQFTPPAVLLDAPIGRDPRHRKKMAVVLDGGASANQARPSQTRFRVLTYYPQYTYIECLPRTGRKHQIRVHAAYLGYPLVGDTMYGRQKNEFGLRRHFLHATELAFKRPSDGELLTIEAELPAELGAILDDLA